MLLIVSLPFLLCRSVSIPDGHVWAGNDRETNGSGETLVTLRIIVLEADLELDGFEEISLLGLRGVLKELLDVGTHSRCGKLSASFTARRIFGEGKYLTDCDFGHDDSLPIDIFGI
jgi:hypothetical protein